MVTVYEHAMAKLAEEVGAEILFVGDSVGQRVLGRKNPLQVQLSEMELFVQAVSSALTRAFVIADLPYMTWQVSDAEAIANAGRLMSVGGADAVAIEGSGPLVAERTHALVRAGIPVMIQLGLTWQSLSVTGGLGPRGQTAAEAKQLFLNARDASDAGAFAILFEMVAPNVTRLVSSRISPLTISQGSGTRCDGTNWLLHDLVGLSPNPPELLSRRYIDTMGVIREALASYIDDIENRRFGANVADLPPAEYEQLLTLLPVEESLNRAAQS